MNKRELITKRNNLLKATLNKLERCGTFKVGEK